MSVSIFDIESYCRVCLHENDSNLSIFDEVQEFNMSILNLLIDYGEMTVNIHNQNMKLNQHHKIINCNTQLVSRSTTRTLIRK